MIGKRLENKTASLCGDAVLLVSRGRTSYIRISTYSGDVEKQHNI